MFNLMSKLCASCNATQGLFAAAIAVSYVTATLIGLCNQLTICYRWGYLSWRCNKEAVASKVACNLSRYVIAICVKMISTVCIKLSSNTQEYFLFAAKSKSHVHNSNAADHVPMPGRWALFPTSRGQSVERIGFQPQKDESDHIIKHLRFCEISESLMCMRVCGSIPSVLRLVGSFVLH